MFARVQIVHQPAEKPDEPLRLPRQRLNAFGARFAGVRVGFYLVDRGAGEAPVISLWDTESICQLDAHARVREQVESEAGMKSPPTRIFEVAVTQI